MVWHIFKKDWKLLWVFVTALVSLHWVGALILFKLGLFGEDPTLEIPLWSAMTPAEPNSSSQSPAHYSQ